MACRAEISLLLAVLCCCMAADGGRAQPEPGLAESPARSRPSLPGVSPSDSPPKKVPALPGTKSPADTLLELLAMNPTERAQALGEKTEQQRNYLETRLREYEALPRQERDRQLQQLDLTWHLDVLMGMPPAARAERLATVSPTLRPLVDERLRQWDLLPPDMQEAVLQHETTANYFVRVPPNTAVARALPPSPPSATPGEGTKSSRAVEQFSHFLELSPEEQQKTLQVLPRGEREEMAKALKVFASMPPQQRKICIASFEKFGRMSERERDQFLKNAARWKAMSPRERETWRSLISILPPPTPMQQPPRLPGVRDDRGPATASNVPSHR